MSGDLDQIANRRHTESMRLLRRILTDLSGDGFTEQDVRDSFNPLVPVTHDKNTLVVRYGKSHLDYLVERKILDYDESTKMYSVNCLSTEVAKEMLSDQDLHYLRGQEDEA